MTDRIDHVLVPTMGFQGREHDLRQLRIALLNDETKIICITRERGAGETALASHVFALNRDYGHATRWQLMNVLGSHLSRIYALLNEDRSRKPADIQRLTGIPKEPMYRCVERYHREYPSMETDPTNETASGNKMSSETAS